MTNDAQAPTGLFYAVPEADFSLLLRMQLAIGLLVGLGDDETPLITLRHLCAFAEYLQQDLDAVIASAQLMSRARLLAIAEASA